MDRRDFLNRFFGVAVTPLAVGHIEGRRISIGSVSGPMPCPGLISSGDVSSGTIGMGGHVRLVSGCICQNGPASGQILFGWQLVSGDVSGGVRWNGR